MKIPSFLNATYSVDLKLSAFVSHALAQIEAHIDASKPVFFPEYTDHSVRHIELVLQTAVDLASPAGRGLLTSSDAAALVIGVSLHDLGMYLTRDGFESLLAESSHWQGVAFFDRASWKALWDDFYAEATRYDGRKLRQLFGDNYRPVRPLPAGSAPWEDFDYLLVGEFLRLHHPRLAHEIALFGLPAKDGNAIQICLRNTDDQRFLADISGMVARSHGLNLRTCIDYLQRKYLNRIDPRGCHPIYLAGLLRIADYFQIQSSRAPTARTNVTSFQSRISEGEWTVHQSVRDINNTGSDPEALVIIADPPDVETFLKIKKWTTGLQRELDQTWAVLGEVYGLQVHSGLNLFGLKIRRIKSNIDDLAEFSKTVSYVPAQLAFEAANADLLKLLVAPLYGNDPGIGIRELFQNAIDAVREFNDTAAHRTEFHLLDRYEQAADVTLQLLASDAGTLSEIVITDRGIGMTAEVIRDYFLRAGASFRRSDAWRREHEDKEGHSRVLRTGRFGVGALAAFLLGDEMEVITRHALADRGDALKFCARLDDEAISLTRVQAPVGTQIRIKIPQEAKKRIQDLVPAPRATEITYGSNIGHYFLKDPSLIRYRSNGTEIAPKTWLPQPTDDISADWRWFNAPGFEKIFWTYNGDYPSLACNGILIGTSSHHPNRALWRFILRPRMSVFDREGSLPVNLQRNGLQAAIPFADQLLASICEDVIAHALIEAPSQYVASTWFDGGGYEGFSKQMYTWPAWLVSRTGIVLNEGHLVARFSPRLIVVAIGGTEDLEPWANTIRGALGDHDLLLTIHPNELNDWTPRVKGLFLEAVRGWVAQPSWIRQKKHATFVPKALMEKVSQLKPGRTVLQTLQRFDKLEDKNGWKRSDRFSCVPEALDEAITSLPIDKKNLKMFCVLEVDVKAEDGGCPSLAQRWIDILGDASIPFAVKLRKQIEARLAEPLPKLLEARRNKAKKRKRTQRSARRDEISLP